jgi:hypothetical protein
MRAIYKNVKYIILLCCSGVFWEGCNIINPVEQTPIFVHIDSFHLGVNPAIIGTQPVTLSNKITAVWAYYNNNLIGEFDLPATFPVITNGSTTGKLQLYPAILVNGLNSSVDIYPFYQPDTSFVVSQSPGTKITYEPRTEYFTKTNFSFQINFEPGPPLKIGTVTGKSMIPSTDAFEGLNSGSVYLSSPGDSSVDSTGRFTLHTGGDAFIEFNYKGDLPIFVGMQSNLSNLISSTPYYLAGVQPSATWQKFYLNINAFALTYPGTNYNFYIKTVLPDGQATGHIFIDNIQLVTF